MNSFDVNSLRDQADQGQQSKSENSGIIQDGQAKQKVLFVCTGNIARSASAQYLAQELAGPDSHWIFDSAGTGAMVDAPVAKYIDQELAERAIPFENHKAKQLTQQLVDESDLVLVMEREHLDWIVQEWPQYRNRTHLLGQVARLRESAGRRVDPISYMRYQDLEIKDEDGIPDPFRKGPEAAADAVKDIEWALNIVIPWLGN